MKRSLEKDSTTGPPLDAALLDTEDEDRTTLDHGAPFVVVEATGDARNDALPGSVDETEGVDGGLDVTDGGGNVWVAAHADAEP